MAIGAIQRRQGKWTESTSNFEKAVALDPKNAGFLYNLGFSYVAQRNFETADKIFDRALVVAPQAFGARALKGVVAILWKGDGKGLRSPGYINSDMGDDAGAEISGGSSSGPTISRRNIRYAYRPGAQSVFRGSDLSLSG
jgi:tetratricopeptide (TPR) repeat protein